MQNEKLRASQDSKLFEQLQKNRDVQRINQQIEKQQQEGPQGTRRRLLATSVKLSPGMAPGLHKIADECIERLSVEMPTELYAYNSPQFNAACVKPEDGKLFIMFSSSLLDAFDEDELKFVMGHELGHFIFDHHAIPVGYLLNGRQKINPELALNLTSWSRYAEFSSDRAGAWCVRDFNAVARSLFKLSSGVTSGIVNFDLQAFLQQVDEMQLENDNLNRSSAQDWFMTHPFSPLRVKALQLFHRSAAMDAGQGISDNDLDLGIEGLMELMSPSYLEAKTEADKAMRHMLFAAALAVASADGEIAKQEIAVFEEFFGKYRYTDKLDIAKLKEHIPQRAQHVIEQTGVAKRMQLIRDLCTMARADEKVTPEEIRELKAMAELLEVPELFVEQSLQSVDVLEWQRPLES